MKIRPVQEFAPRVARACCGLLALAVSAAPLFAQETSFPRLEDYLEPRDLPGYVKRATDYLEQRPSSTFAPRVALDALMAASQSMLPDEAGAMKGCLLFEYPASVQTAFVASMFRDANEFRQFVVWFADRQLEKAPGALPGQFTQVLALGLRQYGDAVLNDPEFLVRAHCFAKAAGSDKAVEVTEAALKKQCLTNTNLAQMVRVHLDRGCDPVRKILMFHAEKKGYARFFERFYCSRLASFDEKRPEIVKIRVENAVESSGYEKALALIDSASGDVVNEPQMLFLKAWACVALERDELAAASLKTISEKHAGTELAAAADLYAEGLRSFASLQKANAEALLAVVNVLKGGVRGLEGTATYVTEPEGPNGRTNAYAAYVGAVVDEGRLDFGLYRGGELILGYRTAANSSAIFLQAEPKILTFEAPGPVPLPSLTLVRKDDTFSFNAGFVMGSSMKDAGATSAALLESPYATTSEGVMSLLSYSTRRRGVVPRKISTAQGLTVYGWLIPSAEAPYLHTLEYRVSADHRVKAFKFRGFEVNRLEYGAKTAVQLTPPAWPDRPTVCSKAFDVAAAARLMGSLLQQFMQDK